MPVTSSWTTPSPTLDLANGAVLPESWCDNIASNTLYLWDTLHNYVREAQILQLKIGATDTNLYRAAANVLKTDDQLKSAVDVYSNDGGAGQIILSQGAGVPTILFGSGLDTNLYRNAANVLKTDDTLSVAGDLVVAGAGGATISTGPFVVNAANAYVGDTANAKMTLGLTLNQGANDNEIQAWKSSDVAHGITDEAETDTFGNVMKSVAGSGGLQFNGYTALTSALEYRAYHTTETGTRATSAIAPHMFTVLTKSGTGTAVPSADRNLLCVRSATTTRFILDSDGDSHQDVGTAWTNFDDHDDAALLTALSVAVSRAGDPVKERFAAILDENRDALERARLVTFNPDGHHFVNMSRLTMALVGAVRQSAERIAALESRLALEGA